MGCEVHLFRMDKLVNSAFINYCWKLGILFLILFSGLLWFLKQTLHYVKSVFTSCCYISCHQDKYTKYLAFS